MRLKFRLSLFFSIVIAAGASMTLVLVRGSTETMFRSFVFSGDAEKAKAYATILGDWYSEKGGWAGVQAFLSEMPDLVSTMIDAKIHGSREVAQGRTPLSAYSSAMLRALVADRVVVADGSGLIVADTAGQVLSTVHPAMHLSHGIPVMSGFERRGTVLVGSMVDSSLTGIGERFLKSVTKSLILSTLVSAGLALVLGLLFASRITKPLGALSQAAKRIAAGDLSLPVPVGGKDELADLSLSFNDMTTELKRLDAAKKQVIADAAHELRTPLTLIQGTIEAMIDGVFSVDRAALVSVHEETVRLSRLVDTLRELEIIESGELVLTNEGVDLRKAIRNALALFAPVANGKSISMEYEALDSPPPVAKGDSLRLGEVIYNLVSNALKYTPEGGLVRIREMPADDIDPAGDKAAGRVGGFLRFSVDDSGPGIPARERGNIFERFYRLDKSRASGSGGRGLGLAIAAEIAKAHGGTITISESDLGGARFIVCLPALLS